MVAMHATTAEKYSGVLYGTSTQESHAHDGLHVGLTGTSPPLLAVTVSYTNSNSNSNSNSDSNSDRYAPFPAAAMNSMPLSRWSLMAVYRVEE
jgi:hypothetical protein